MIDWHGIFPVATTPFDADLELDLTGYAANLDSLVAAGIHGVISLATAGEGPSMSRDEAARVVTAAVETVSGRIPVLAGVGGPNERDTKDQIRVYERAGVDGFMVVTPYFYPLTRAEMTDYFRRIGAATELPFMIYNSTYANLPLTADVVEELAGDIPNFVALKEGNQLQASDVIRRVGGRLKVFTARDIFMHELYAAGGHGAIAFASNVAPRLVIDLYEKAQAGEWSKARAIQDSLNPLIWLLVKRSFPGMIKAAMDLVGLKGGPVRPPLSQITDDEVADLRAALKDLGLID